MHESKEEDTQRMEGATLPFQTPPLPAAGRTGASCRCKTDHSPAFSLKRENILFIFSSEEAAVVYFHLCFHHRLLHNPEELKLAQRGFRR